MPLIDLVIQIFSICKKLIFLVSCSLLHDVPFGKMALCFPLSTKLAEEVQLPSCHLIFILLLFHTVLTPYIELFGYWFPLTIILLESLMFMVPMMSWKDQRCGVGQLTICLQLLGFCVVTSIWLKWPLTKMKFFPFNGWLGKWKPGTTCAINWTFFYRNINYYHDSRVWHTWSNFRASSNHILKHLEHAMITTQQFFSFLRIEIYLSFPYQM